MADELEAIAVVFDVIEAVLEATAVSRSLMSAEFSAISEVFSAMLEVFVATCAASVAHCVEQSFE
jgi:hypothetical protein